VECLKDRELVPEAYTRLRTCLKCRLIKSESQWLKEGCDNCPNLEIQGDVDRMVDCTTGGFEGVIALMAPGKSWSGRWNKVDRGVAGCYAVEVDGEVPGESSGGSSEEEDDED